MSQSVQHHDDATWLRRAIALAQNGIYTTTPNPRVGAVIVSPHHQLLGEGWHEKAGMAHAEIAAIRDAQKRGNTLRGGTMYVSLEPCNHHGKTPPCSEAIIKAGITRVVAAMPDPNPNAQGGGDTLKAAGVAFSFADDKSIYEKARTLNRGFISRVTRGRPFVRVKAAMSLDGRTALANGKSQWITGEAARHNGHHYRAMACAVLTGIGTVLADNPALTVRAVDTPRQPLRVVLDTHGKMPRDATIVRDGHKTLIVTARALRDYPIAPSESIDIVTMPAVDEKNPKTATIDVTALMYELARRDINELHVEAGSVLNGALLAADLIDELLLYISPRVLGQHGLPLFHMDNAINDLEVFHRFTLCDTLPLGEDVGLVWRRKDDE